MTISIIIIVAVSVLFVTGGLVFGHMATKASEKFEKQEANKPGKK